MYNDRYLDVDWAMIDDEEEDTVIDTYKRGDKVQLDDGSIGYIHSNRMSSNSYNIIGPYRLWCKNNVDGDSLTLIQEVQTDRLIVGDPVVKANKCRIPRLSSKRKLGYIVEASLCKGSQLTSDVVSVMFDDAEVYNIRRSDLIKVHEATVGGCIGDEKYEEQFDNLIDAIGTGFLNGEILKVKSAGDNVTSYHLVVHNDKFKTLSEVYISNEFISETESSTENSTNKQ